MGDKTMLKWDEPSMKLRNSSTYRATKARQQAEHGLAMAMLRGDDDNCIAYCMEKIEDTYVDKKKETC